MVFENSQEKEFIMRNIKNVFKNNAKEAKEKEINYVTFGMTPNEFRFSRYNPTPGILNHNDALKLNGKQESDPIDKKEHEKLV